VTWFAEEILAPARPGVVEELSSFSGYRDAIYVIREIPPQEWWPEPIRHGVPPEGLVFVRPVGEPGHHETWLGPVIPWLPPPGRGAIAPEIAEADVRLEEVSAADVLPPHDFLAYLKHVSATHHAPVAYGFFSTWGGTNELEYAWIFSDSERLLINETTGHGCVEFRPGGASTAIDQPLLSVLASALGFTLRDGYFAPHTRAFDWERHRFRRAAKR
jgi:hypothetical protein